MKKLLPILCVGVWLATSANAYPQTTDSQSPGFSMFAASRQQDPLTGLPADKQLSQRIATDYMFRLVNAKLQYIKIACNPVFDSAGGKPAVHTALDVSYVPSGPQKTLRLMSRTFTHCTLGDKVVITAWYFSGYRSSDTYESNAYSNGELSYPVIVLQLENALRAMGNSSGS